MVDLRLNPPFRCLHRLEKELARLEKNQQSRHQREHQKTKKVQTAVQSWPAGILANPHAQDLDSGQQNDSGPSSSAAPSVIPAPKVGDTQNRRRCTACGQSGHYRSNRKYTITLPLLSPFFAEQIMAVGSALCIWASEGIYFEVTTLFNEI